MTGDAVIQAAGRRVAVIGDIGGHVAELRRELSRLGADERTGQLPDDLIVVQVGDLIHRGPDSAGVVELVDSYLASQPDQWVQLVGNHEAQYLREQAFDWPERLPERSVRTLQRWWAEGQMSAAVAVPTRTETHLISHAGLTRGYWRQVLDRLVSAERVATALNSFIGTHEDVLFAPGQMLGGGRPNQAAGPIWAAAGTELIPSWLGVRMPFSQVHGHSTVVGLVDRGAEVPSDIQSPTTVDRAAGHEVTELPGGRIIGVDPGHGRRARSSWQSWVITG